MTYLLFIKRLDELHTMEERKSQTLRTPMERRIFPEGNDEEGHPDENLRWSRFKNFETREMIEVKAFEDTRLYGSHDAEAAYRKSPEFASEAATGRTARAVRALQLETELRTDPQLRADRFVERWQKLGRASQRQC